MPYDCDTNVFVISLTIKEKERIWEKNKYGEREKKKEGEVIGGRNTWHVYGLAVWSEDLGCVWYFNLRSESNYQS